MYPTLSSSERRDALTALTKMSQDASVRPTKKPHEEAFL
jgi:hypothetical protein